MRGRRQFCSHKPPDAFYAILLILSILLLAGMLLGKAACDALGGGEAQQVEGYVMQYAALWAEENCTTASLLSVLTVYLRYPLFTFLCGFTAAGMVLIPVLCLMQGFFLGFSVSCFTSALGHSGVELAMCAFGLRCLFVLPCTLILAVWAVAKAAERRCYRRERHKRDRILCGSAYFFRALNCLMILLAGVALELWLVPKGFGLVLPKLLPS